MERIWLDHNAGTAVDPRVLEQFVAFESLGLANPASVHARGRAAKAVLEDARARTASALGVRDDEVVFVSGGSEGNNIAVRGLGMRDLPVLLAPLEHPSVLEPAMVRGLVPLAVDAEGRAVVVAPTQRVGLIALVHAQSEIGTLQPIVTARALATSLGVPLHVDAAQTLGRVSLEEAIALADTLSLATHKAGGLRGQSVLVVRRRVRDSLAPLAHGGGQEQDLRPGTPSPALCAATALAIELATRETETRAGAMRAARAAFLAELGTSHCSVLTREPALPNTVLLLLEVRDGRTIVPALDMLGVEASQGSACSSGASLPPRVLLEMGFAANRARCAVRFSFAATTTIAAARLAAERVRAFLTRENLRGDG